jgi:hypothetical protein
MSLKYNNVEYDLNKLFSFQFAFEPLKMLLVNFTQSQKASNDKIKELEKKLSDRDNIFKNIESQMKKISKKFDDKIIKIENNFNCIREGNTDFMELNSKQGDGEESEIGFRLADFIKDDTNSIDFGNDKNFEMKETKMGRKSDSRYDDRSKNVERIETHVDNIVYINEHHNKSPDYNMNNDAFKPEVNNHMMEPNQVIIEHRVEKGSDEEMNNYLKQFLGNNNEDSFKKLLVILSNFRSVLLK